MITEHTAKHLWLKQYDIGMWIDRKPKEQNLKSRNNCAMYRSSVSGTSASAFIGTKVLLCF